MSAAQFAYVLTGGGQGLLADVLRVAVYVNRQVHPRARCVLATDPATRDELHRKRSPLPAMLDDLIVIDTGSDDAKTASRFIKTTLRQHVRGDYLFLDVDAIPIRPLDELFALDADVAMALDRNRPTSSKVVLDPWIADLYRAQGWPTPRRYYNSGVALFRDNEKARALSARWHELWQITRRCGRPEDQPALNRAIDEMTRADSSTSRTPSLSVHTLEPRWNALIYLRPASVRGAAVVHFLMGNWQQRRGEVLFHLVEHLRTTGGMDQAMIDRFIATGCPWTDRTDPLARWAMGDYAAAAGCALLPRNMGRAVRAVAALGRRAAGKARRISSGTGANGTS